LHRFHTFKDVFLLGRASKKAKAKANAQRMELPMKRKVDEETNAETWTPSKKWREINPWRDYITHEIDVSKELDADINFPKIHFVSHWVEQIRRYRAFQEFVPRDMNKHIKRTSKTVGTPPITISTTCRK
jgi:hypothetical protein